MVETAVTIGGDAPTRREPYWREALRRHFGPFKRRWCGRSLVVALRLRRANHGEAKRFATSFYEFGSPEVLTVPGGADAWPERIQFDQPFVGEFRNASIIGPAGLCFCQNGASMLDVSMNDAAVFEAAVNQNWRRLLRLRAKPRQIVREPVAVLVHAYAENYYHWHIECLAKLQGIHHYESVTGRRIRLLVPRAPPPWMRQTWEAIGYTNEDILPVNDDLVLCETAVISTNRRNNRAAAPSACAWLKDTVGAAVRERRSAGVPSRRLYVSRRSAKSRHVLNEKHLISALTARGFAVVVPESLPFEEQAKLFSNAHLVVSPFGSGLTNTLYGTNVSVIEFGGRDYNPTLRYLAAACGHRYRCIRAKDVGGDLVVDIGSVLEAVNQEHDNHVASS